jgi:hypothetical protein
LTVTKCFDPDLRADAGKLPFLACVAARNG